MCLGNKKGDNAVAWVCLGCIIYLLLLTMYEVYMSHHANSGLSVNEHSICEQVDSEVYEYSADEVVCMNGLKFSRK